MSNKASRLIGLITLGRRQGKPAASTLNDIRLLEGLSINDAEPFIATADRQASLIQVRCHCGSVLAKLWSVDRRPRMVSPAVIYYLEAQVIDDPSDRPVTVRIVRMLVEPGASLVADCPAHGRHEVASDPLIRAARKVKVNAETMGKFILPRVGGTQSPDVSV